MREMPTRKREWTAEKAAAGIPGAQALREAGFHPVFAQDVEVGQTIAYHQELFGFNFGVRKEATVTRVRNDQMGMITISIAGEPDGEIDECDVAWVR